MNEPTITCPHCANEIKLTESLAAPLIRATRLEYEAKILQKEVDVSQREAALRHQQKALEDSQKQLDEQISARLKVERITIAADEAKKAKLVLAADLERKIETTYRITASFASERSKIGRSTESTSELVA